MPAIGIDLLGLGSKYFLATEQVIEIIPSGYAIGAFDTTFGNVVPKVRQLLLSGKYPFCRIHIVWTDNHKFGPLDPVRKRAAVYEALALEFPKVKIYLSHHCEANENDKAQVAKRIAALQRFAPHCVPVNSNIAGVVLPTLVNEFHDDQNSYKPRYIASMDGCADGAGAWHIDSRGWKRLHNRAELLLYWVPEINGRKAGKPALPRPQRRKFITAAELKEVVKLTKQ